MAELSEPFEQLPIRMRKILFASNFSETSAMALPYAAAFARRFHAEIWVEHVIPTEEYAHIAPEQLGATLQAMKQTARERIEHLLADSRFSDIAFRIVLDHGDAMRAIALLVQAEGIDLIVAGSHGRHGLQKLFAPPVDEEIARAAACPVLLVGPKVAVEAEAEARVHRILHPTELRDSSRPAMEFACALARVYEAELYVLHVAEDIWREPLSTRMTPDAFCRMRLLESGLPESTLGVEPQFLVDFGPAESLILEAAEKHDVQLVVIGVPGAAHPELISHFPGPLAYDIASHSRCPVLAVRNKEAAA
jgi:nucleotide-binding universal stress UspA family protein